MIQSIGFIIIILTYLYFSDYLLKHVRKLTILCWSVSCTAFFEGLFQLSFTDPSLYIGVVNIILMIIMILKFIYNKKGE